MLDLVFSRRFYYICVFVVILFLLSLGFVCASVDDSGIGPFNDSFVNNDSEFDCDGDSYDNSGFDNNFSNDDLVLNNSSLDFNSSNRDFVLNNSSLDFNLSFDDGSGNSPLSLIQTSITASNLVMDFQDGSSLYAYLKDKNNNPLSGKTLSFNINGNTYNQVTNANGRAGLVINEIPGIYTTVVSFQGSGYVSSTRTVSVTVNEMPVNITANNITMYYRDGSAISATLTDRNGNPLVNKTITLNLDGHIYTRITNDNGRIGFGIYARPGNYTFNITFQDVGYVSTSRLVNVVVYEMPTSLVCDDVVMYYRDGSAISATLKDINGDPLANKTITLNLDGHIYTRVTNDNGRIGFGIYARPGNYTFNITFEDIGYFSSSKLVNVAVYEMPTSLVCDDVVMYYRDGSAISATLKDINNNPLINKTITLNLEGHIYTRITNDNGRIGFGIYARPGNYTFNITFDDIGYISSSKLVNVAVYEMPTNIIANNLVIYYGDTTRLYATLKDKDNNPLVNKTILYNFNSNVYTRITNDNGRVGMTIQANPSIYDAIISFSEIGYVSSVKHVNVTVLGGAYPSVNVSTGIYNVSHLTLGISLNDAISYNYSWDGVNWTTSNQSMVFNLKNGEYDLYLSNGTYNFHYHYLVDNVVPFVWASHNSDLYDDNFLVNLSSWDNLDNTTPIYYTLNGADPTVEGVLYDNTPLNISDTATLKFYTYDSAGHFSGVFTCNYIFSKVGNLNSGRGFSRIQDAIDDNGTVDGDIIKVSSGSYQENIIVNKTLNLIANSNVVLKSPDSTLPVVNITSKGNASFIYGFNILNSTVGVVLDNTCNVTLLFNSFHNVITSIIVEGDDNLISGNNITSDYLWNMVGIKIKKSKNLTIYNNTICFNSNSNSTCILSESTLSDGLSITYNVITNLNHGKSIALSLLGSNMDIEYNNIFNVNVGVYVIDLNNSFIAHNTLFDNIDGVFIRNSINNTYCSNNIYNNDYYGTILATGSIGIDDSFYLNRLYDNEYYDFYSKSTSQYVIDDNWWGVNSPTISVNLENLANIYNNTGNIVMGSWVVMRLYSCSYKVNGNSLIERAKFYLDMTYNNLNQSLSYKGYLPDGLEANIVVYNILNMVESSFAYLENGRAFADFELSNLFRYFNIIGVYARFDNQEIITTFENQATIDMYFMSSAWDVDKNSIMNEFISIPFDNSPTWITFSWAETGLYTGILYLIVNGEIIKEINITNRYYQMFKNVYSSNVFVAMKFFNNVFASSKDGIWVPNNYYLSFAQEANIDYMNFEEVYYRFLSYIYLYYNLTMDDISFIHNYKGYFVDNLHMFVDFHGDVAEDINFIYNGERKLLNPMSTLAYRVSNIYYTDITDENDISIGYEGMRSFAVAKDNVTNDDLNYWLNQKSLYSPGLMKAAYGTFLSALLVIYENDRVADEAADKFNVTWGRVSPTCVSLCNDFNSLYITGESDHNLGREAVGNSSGVWKFNFATSFSFSLVEQLVGNNVWNDTTIGSVTLGLIQSYINNETIEIITSNGYVIIKRERDNNTLLILDLETGIVRDYFSNYGLLGTMPCYHDNITENTWNYGRNLLNISSSEYYDFESVINYSIDSVFFNTVIEDEYWSEIESFFTSLIIGVVGSELVSGGIVLTAGGVITDDVPLSILGIFFFAFGEVGLLYSDGLLDGDITYIDVLFFGIDNVLALSGPLSGGLKLGTQITKIAFERIILSKGGKLTIITSIDIDEIFIRYNPIELILKNNYDDPFIQQIINFFNTNFLPPIFKEEIEKKSNR